VETKARHEEVTKKNQLNEFAMIEYRVQRSISELREKKMKTYRKAVSGFVTPFTGL
jgi:hypothetical protein